MKSIAECLDHAEIERTTRFEERELLFKVKSLLSVSRALIRDLNRQVENDTKEKREIDPASVRFGKLEAYKNIERFLSDATRGING